MKLALIAAALALAVPSLAQDAAAPPPAPAVPAPIYATVRVTLTTAEGPIVLELEKERAPLTTANFLRYVDQKRLDGAMFYRALKSTPDGSYGLIQGGVRNDPKRILPPVAHEPTSKTGLSHTDGAISMARAAPGSARAEFFIILGGLTALDADPSKPGDNAGYAVFGHVAEGMDTVKRIVTDPVSPTAGEGAMKGQMLVAPVKIITARRTPKPAAPPVPQ